MTVLLGCFTMQASPPLAAPVALAWKPSTNSTIAGYHIYYGTASRNYTNVVSAGNSSSATISNLLAGATYYFAATSYTATGLESDYSGEAAYAVPTNAMLHASIASDSNRSLTIVGLIGSVYQIQSATNLGPSTVWSPFLTYSQTNFIQTINVTSSVPQVFYRVANGN